MYQWQKTGLLNAFEKFTMLGYLVYPRTYKRQYAVYCRHDKEKPVKILIMQVYGRQCKIEIHKPESQSYKYV